MRIIIKLKHNTPAWCNRKSTIHLVRGVNECQEIECEKFDMKEIEKAVKCGLLEVKEVAVKHVEEVKPEKVEYVAETKEVKVEAEEVKEEAPKKKSRRKKETE